MEERQAELLPVPYFHIVFTLPAAIGDIAYQNKAVIYDLLFKASAETMLTIAADPKHLGARIAITVGAAHLGLGHDASSARAHDRARRRLSPDGKRWIAAKPNFFLPVLVLSRLFRRLMLEKLAAAHKAGKLTFFGEHAHLADAKAFAAFLAPLKRTRWFVYSKRPFAGPKAVLAYLARYTHRVAISNSRLIAADADERHLQGQGLPGRGARPLHDHDARHARVHPPLPHPRPAQGLPPHPPLRPPRRRHARPEHRAGSRAPGGAQASPPIPRTRLPPMTRPQSALATPCPCCGGRMIVIETFEAGCQPRNAPTIRIDTS